MCILSWIMISLNSTWKSLVDSYKLICFVTWIWKRFQYNFFLVHLQNRQEPSIPCCLLAPLLATWTSFLFRSLAGFHDTCSQQVLWERENGKSHRLLWSSLRSLTHHHVHHIPFIRSQVTKSSFCSRRVESGSTFRREEYQIICALF